MLFLDNKGKTWYDALAMKADRPYAQLRPGFGWGAGVAYTFAKRETAGYNDNFSFPNPIDYPRAPRNDERHRIVSNFVVDVPYAFGIQASGLITLGSGIRYDRGDRFACINDSSGQCTIRAFYPGAGIPTQHSFLGLGHWAYRNIDLHLRKDFLQLGGNRVGVTFDAFNVFNWQNLGGYQNAFVPSDPNFGRATNTISDPRRFQLGAEYDF